MLLEVVIVSYNTEKLLEQCLQSLFDNLKQDNLEKDTAVTVVDNASRDGSVSMVKENFPRVKIISNRQNFGFAKANNQAIKKSQASFILLLNSDTKLREGCLKYLLEEIKKDPKTAIVGPKILNRNGTLQQSVGFFPTLSRLFLWMFFIDDLPFLSRYLKPYHAADPFFYRKVRQVDWLTGACLMFRKSTADKVGYLAEDIFMYGEEVEWCYRAKLAGFNSVLVPSARIIHFKGRSSKGALSGIVEEFNFIIWFYRKYYPGLLFPARLILSSGALLRLILFGIIGHNRKVKLYAEALQVAG